MPFRGHIQVWGHDREARLEGAIRDRGDRASEPTRGGPDRASRAVGRPGPPRPAPRRVRDSIAQRNARLDQQLASARDRSWGRSEGRSAGDSAGGPRVVREQLAAPSIVAPTTTRTRPCRFSGPDRQVVAGRRVKGEIVRPHGCLTRSRPRNYLGARHATAAVAAERQRTEEIRPAEIDRPAPIGLRRSSTGGS